ncbi:hypothetical protein [Paludibaculum fermentans]|uniref:hypothetical protein n=1 Tax=Paludibaculum fermentans TaxID=1473598 RepID=UPI003EB76ACB
MATGKIAVLAVVLAGSVLEAGAPLDGVWRSIGWGDVYVVRGDSWQTFEVTASTCVAGFSARRMKGSGDHFRAIDVAEFSVADEPDGLRKRLIRAGEINSLLMERVAEVPAACAPITANTPLGNFDVFARTFAEQYIGFGLRGVDWAQRVAEQRARVRPETTAAGSG